MNKYICLIFYFIINFGAHCQAPLSDNVGGVLKQLNLKREDCYEDLITEKALPYSKDRSVIVIPKVVEHGEGYFVLDGYILIADTKSGKILNLFYESNAWMSDAIKLESIAVDFAPYKLNSNIRAFGVRTKYNGSSRPNPISQEYISLFYPENNKLIEVLKDFTIYFYHGEWDTNCNGEFHSENSLLVMSEQQTNGFNNIISKVTCTTTRTLIDDDCREEEKVKKKTEVLTFNGEEYK